ncbi:MAG TPA: glycosyltransferase family 4 protein [Planctomycetota bacterium]|nr:glycosyltransferase family 4 protein [Planctomycetota bacterium]
MKVAMLGLRGVEDGLGGVEKVVREVSTRLAAKGVDVTCFCRKRYNPRTEFNGVKLVNTRTIYTKHLETAFYALGSMWSAARGDFDVIHIHALASSSLAWIPKWFTKKKVVVTIHGLDWQRAKWGFFARRILQFSERCAVRFADLTVCVSLSLQIYFQMRYMQRHFAYIPNGCDPASAETFAPPDGYCSNGYILFMGRLVPEKGVHRLIEAYKGLKTDKPLVIAGPEQHAAGYCKHLHELADGDARIRFLGSITGEVKERFLSNAYVFVLPSEIEGLPVSVLEAACRGVCPVVSSIPTTIEVLGERGLARGFTFDSSSPKELRTVLETCLENPELVDALGQQAKEFVVANYNWDIIAAETLRAYQKVLE